MDQEDIHDKIVEDDYDYHDDATSFDYSTDTTLQNQVLDIGAKDAVVEFARRHKKKQTIILKPAGTSMRATLNDNADSPSPAGHIIEVVSPWELPPEAIF